MQSMHDCCDLGGRPGAPYSKKTVAWIVLLLKRIQSVVLDKTKQLDLWNMQNFENQEIFHFLST